MKTSDYSLILFDGYCNLCDKWVQTVIKWDKKKHFKFASLQSSTGKKLVEQFKLQEYDSIVLIDKNEASIESAAAFNILRKLSGPMRLFLILSILPKSITDWGYRLIARNRFRIFGKKEVCMVPSEKLKLRFIDD